MDSWSRLGFRITRGVGPQRVARVGFQGPNHDPLHPYHDDDPDQPDQDQEQLG